MLNYELPRLIVSGSGGSQGALRLCRFAEAISEIHVVAISRAVQAIVHCVAGFVDFKCLVQATEFDQSSTHSQVDRADFGAVTFDTPSSYFEGFFELGQRCSIVLLMGQQAGEVLTDESNVERVFPFLLYQQAERLAVVCIGGIVVALQMQDSANSLVEARSGSIKPGR